MPTQQTTAMELRREGKRHSYEVWIDGRFVGHVQRALIGVWVGALAGGRALEAGKTSTFPTKEAAARTVCLASAIGA